MEVKHSKCLGKLCFVHIPFHMFLSTCLLASKGGEKGLGFLAYKMLIRSGGRWTSIDNDRKAKLKRKKVES
jgi:hypothetical protein